MNHLLLAKHANRDMLKWHAIRRGKQLRRLGILPLYGPRQA